VTLVGQYPDDKGRHLLPSEQLDTPPLAERLGPSHPSRNP
jgi:hypothetical protein